MNALSAIDEMGRQQERILRKTMVLSVVAHAAIFLLGSAIAPLFPSMPFQAPVFVELTDAPMSELPEEPPTAPLRVASASPAAAVPNRYAGKGNSAASAYAAPRTAVPDSPVAKENSAARRWLEKLDAGDRNFPEAPIVRKEVRPDGIPVRTWTNEGPAKSGDFPPAVSSGKNVAMRKHLEELEARVRQSGQPAVSSGSETEASMMFGGTGTSANEQIPPWIRDMIRKRVRGYLPELEAAYTVALRRNPALKGKLIVRFRIDPSGNVPSAVAAESSFEDGSFNAIVIGKIRKWTFDPPAGQTVEVLYPFVFTGPG